jgi:hypothetical protein
MQEDRVTAPKLAIIGEKDIKTDKDPLSHSRN